MCPRNEKLVFNSILNIRAYLKRKCDSNQFEGIHLTMDYLPRCARSESILKAWLALPFERNPYHILTFEIVSSILSVFFNW